MALGVVEFPLLRGATSLQCRLMFKLLGLGFNQLLRTPMQLLTYLQGCAWPRLRIADLNQPTCFLNMLIITEEATFCDGIDPNRSSLTLTFVVLTTDV